MSIDCLVSHIQRELSRCKAPITLTVIGVGVAGFWGIVSPETAHRIPPQGAAFLTAVVSQWGNMFGWSVTFIAAGGGVAWLARKK